MREYEKYKPSSIDYPKELPENWAIIRLKDLGNLQNGISNGKDYFGFGFPFVSYGNVYNDTIRLSEIKTLANSSAIDQKAYSVLEGDVFFTRTSETIDEIGIASTCLTTISKATFSGFTIRLRPKLRVIIKEFSKYFFKAHTNRQFLSKEINLVTRASLSQNLLNNLPVLLPPLAEQTAIAQYLDTKTQAIDKKINLLTRKTDCYQELRKTLINEAVTKGLDKDVALKESGIEWIGKIPEHWEVKRLKFFAFTIKGKNVDLSDIPFENSLPYLSLEYLRNERILMPNYGITKDKSQICTENDLIVIWDGAGVGEILRAKKGILSSTTAKFSFNRTCNFKFFFHIRDQIEYTLKQIPTGMGIPHLNPHVLNNFPCPYPPLEEQAAIANYLDKKTSTIDTIIANLQKQIETLQELRKTLINDVVTGKVKVV